MTIPEEIKQARWIVKDDRTGCIYTIVIGVIGALIGGSNYYKLWIDQAVKCETPADVENVQETFAYEVNSRFVSDADLGGPIKVTLVNTLSAL